MSAPVREKSERLDYMPGELFIRFKKAPIVQTPGMAAVRMLSAHHVAELPESVSGPIEYLKKNMGMKGMSAIFASEEPKRIQSGALLAARPKALAVASVVAAPSDELSGINIVKVDPKAVTAARIKSLQQSTAIEYVERVPARWFLAKPKRATKSDPSANRQWGLAAIEWFGANLPSASTVNVAVLDTGIDDKHPDLKANIASYETNGFSKTDIVGHGTHVAGIIAAVVNNNIGIAGVAQCRLHSYKIFPDTKINGDYYVDQDAYLRSLLAAVDNNCKVINLSIGGTEISRTEQLTLAQVIDRGCTVVAAMGNEYEEGNPKEYPGGFDGVIAVGATDQANRRASFSNTGKHIHLVAPGVKILSTLPMKASRGYRDETEYAAWDGTSMATPHVVGAVALLLAKKHSLSPAQVRNYLEKRSAKVAAMRGKPFTQTFGHGLLNIPKLLK